MIVRTDFPIGLVFRFCLRALVLALSFFLHAGALEVSSELHLFNHLLNDSLVLSMPCFLDSEDMGLLTFNILKR